MTVNPYTMNNLYAQGILDYVPYDLGYAPNVSSYANFPNPYMQTAMQGDLYRNYGLGNDSFVRSAGMNGFGLPVGAESNAGMNGFGIQGVGDYSQAGINGFGGGFGTLGQNFSQGVSNTISFAEKIPAPIKGILALGVIGGALALCFRIGKKPASSQGFFSKLGDKLSDFGEKLKFWKKK